MVSFILQNFIIFYDKMIIYNYEVSFMDYNDVFKSIDKLFAYDTGASDSGVKDENLRTKIIKYINKLSDDEFRIFMSTYIRERFVSEDAIKNGYGIEDVKSFIEWLDEYMKCSL